MNDSWVYRRLLAATCVALVIATILVAIGYFFVDRPVAFWVREHGFSHDLVLKWLTYPPPILQAWAPVMLVGLMVRRDWGPWHHRWEQTLLAASVGVILADQFRVTLSYVFGRYWPGTWIDDNPSLLGDGAYGFHPFHEGSAYESFPSGHAARTLAIVAPVWLAYP